MGYDYILLDRSDAIATITLNRPDKLNALYGSMREEIVDALGVAAADRDVRAILVTGAGRGFCAGGDITYMAGLIDASDEKAFRGLVAAGSEVVKRIRKTPKPVVAAVNGVAAGGGANLALACDFRIASREASFAQSFVKIGMHPDWGGTYLLPRIVGTARALELALTGRSVKADEALSLGLVTRVVEPAVLLAEARAFAGALGAGPPRAIAAIKESFYGSLEMSLDQALDREVEAQLELFRSKDAREGMAAFREKRKAEYTGE